jgi:hypothetical protein
MLPIEQGRWDNMDRNNRIYFLCNSDIGDDFHYCLQCQYFKPSRKLLLYMICGSKSAEIDVFFCVPGVQNSLPFGRML